MLKERFIKYFAFILVLWYIVSVTGLDVHTCSHSGKVYVVPLAESTKCSDIHPSDSCSEHACGSMCQEDELSSDCRTESSVSQIPCCENETHNLQITGISSDSRHFIWKGKCVFCTAVLPQIIMTAFSAPAAERGTVPWRERGCLPDASEILTEYCVWRI